MHAVSGDGFAGVERYICVVAKSLAQRGHRLDIVGGHPERMRIELGQTIAHTAARSVREVIDALRAVGEVDLVHAHMTAGEVGAVASKVWNAAPIVCTRHFAARRGSSPVVRALGPLIAAAIAEEIAISRFVANSIEGGSVLLHNGVASQPAAPLASPRVLMMQRLDPEKDTQVGLKAWALSGLARMGWTIDVVGTGALAERLCSLSRELGVERSVTFHGRVDNTDEMLARAAIFLAPAPLEPFGLAVTEAMSHGVPVVAARGGGHTETLGEHGRFFDPGDAAGAASELRRLAGNAKLRHSLALHARARQQRLFALDRHVDRLERIYWDVAKC